MSTETKQQFFSVFPSSSQPFTEDLPGLYEVKRGNKSFLFACKSIISALLSCYTFPKFYLYAVDFRSPDEFVSLGTKDELRLVLNHPQGPVLLSIERVSTSTWLSLQVFPGLDPSCLLVENRRISDFPYYPDLGSDYSKNPIRYTDVFGLVTAFSSYLVARSSVSAWEGCEDRKVRTLSEYIVKALEYNTLLYKKYHGYGRVPNVIILGYTINNEDFGKGDHLLVNGVDALVHVKTTVPLLPNPSFEYTTPVYAPLKRVWVDLNIGLETKTTLYTDNFYIPVVQVDESEAKSLLEIVSVLNNCGKLAKTS